MIIPPLDSSNDNEHSNKSCPNRKRDNEPSGSIPDDLQAYLDKKLPPDHPAINYDLDEKLIDSKQIPTERELRMALRALLKNMLIWVETKPDNAAINLRKDELNILVNVSSSFTDLMEDAIYLFERTFGALEQLNCGDMVHKWLMLSFPPMSLRHPALIPRWRSLMLMHARYAAQRHQADMVIIDMIESLRQHPGAEQEINYLLLLKSTTPTARLLELANSYLAEVEPHADDASKLQICSVLSRTLLERQEQALALKYAQQGLVLARRLNNQVSVINHLCYIAAIWQNSDDLRDVEQAIVYLEEADKLALELDDLSRLAHIGTTRANCLLKQGNYQEAVDILYRIVPQFDHEGLHFGRSFYVLGLAAFNATLQQANQSLTDGLASAHRLPMHTFRDAFRIMRYARDAMEGLGASIDVVNIDLGIIDCKFRAGDHRGAVDHFLKHLMPLLVENPQAITPLQQPYVDDVRAQLVKIGFDL